MTSEYAIQIWLHRNDESQCVLGAAYGMGARNLRYGRSIVMYALHERASLDCMCIFYVRDGIYPESSILTWHRGYHDPLGGSPSVRPFHCTEVGLTAAIIPNVDDSGAQFLLVGDCVRAIPLH